MKVWTVQKELLTHASSFFHAAINHPWAESESKTIELKEDDPDAFEFFLHWLFAWALKEDGKYPREISQGTDPMLSLRAWVLGDKLGCPHFQDFAFVHLHRGLAKEVESTHKIIREAYANTPSGSKLRSYVAAILLDWMTDKKYNFRGAGAAWVEMVGRKEDLAIDIVTLQMLNAKPFKLSDNLSQFFLVSSLADFDAK